jgi:subtilisin family serine protease
VLLLAPGALYAQSSNVASVKVTVTPQGAAATTSMAPAEALYHPSRVLVRFRDKADFLPGSAAAQPAAGPANVYVVKNPPGLSVPEVLQRYRADPNVLYAEPDFVVRAVDTTPNDTFWSAQWDMTQISAPRAWDTQTNASDVVVAIIDTGIDYAHPDLQGNLYSDASSNHGYTCINGSCAPGGLDDYGHGTHVAGTIGAVGNNGIGIAGINWQVQLLSIKFLDSTGSGYISDAVLAFNLVTQLKNSGVNIRLTNNSWGGGGYTQSLKDAMTAAEAAGILNVCAAGNSGQNADVFPMYPAAYDNRGIISVLASDNNDAGAYFTDYGLASVDIAAPGVSTYSTVPSGSCTLCDPSGYTYLSGTSMATPHVTGVLAALLHLYPALTPYQARDEVLDPNSYDAVTNALAQSTSTGGRLNFAKAINNTAYLSANPLPPLNNFPVLTMGPNVFASSGAPVSVTASASDADSDPLRMAWSKIVDTGSQWLFGYMLNYIFPNPSGSSVSFTAPALGRTATVPYNASVADGRGGGAAGLSYVTVSPSGSPGQPPSGTLSLSSSSIAVGSSVTVNFPVTDPGGGPLYWDLWASGQYGASGWCCYTGSSTSLTFNSAGVYRVAVQAIDPQLNLSARSTAVVSVGGSAGQPPIAAATLDKLSGPVPFTVNIDMSSSSAPGGTIQSYFFICGGSGVFTAGTTSSQGSCTYTTPGAYWIMPEVMDNNGNLDLVSEYVVATPAANGADTTPPSVYIATPASGANVNGSVSVTATASDNAGGSGMKQVVFRLDSSTILGTITSAPYTIIWNASTASVGLHTLAAIATDNAGNSATSAGVNVTVSDFTISATPSSRSVLVGSSTTYTASVSPLDGFSSAVALSVSGLPSGATASFSPTSLTGSGTSTLTVKAGTAAAGGPYTLTIGGQSGTLGHTTTVSFATTATDFGISLSTSNPSANQGQSTTAKVTVAPLNGFSGSVSFSLSGVSGPLPAGLAASFSPAKVTRSGNTTLTLTATAIAAGAYSLQVTGTSGSLTHSAALTLTVKLGGSVSVTANPTKVTVSRSTSPSAKTTLTVSASSGFVGSVTLSASGLPGGGTASFSPATISVSPGSPASSTMTVTVSANTNTGQSNINVTAKSSGGPQAQKSVTLQVNK